MMFNLFSQYLNKIVIALLILYSKHLWDKTVYLDCTSAHFLGLEGWCSLAYSVVTQRQNIHSHTFIVILEPTD